MSYKFSCCGEQNKSFWHWWELPHECHSAAGRLPFWVRCRRQRYFGSGDHSCCSLEFHSADQLNRRAVGVAAHKCEGCTFKQVIVWEGLALIIFEWFTLKLCTNFQYPQGLLETTTIHTHIHTCSQLIVSSSPKCVSLWTVRGSQRTQRGSTPAQEEHPHSTQKGPRTRDLTNDPLVVRQRKNNKKFFTKQNVHFKRPQEMSYKSSNFAEHCKKKKNVFNDTSACFLLKRWHIALDNQCFEMS